MLNINRALNNKRLMLSLTGLSADEFYNLLPSFSLIWQKAKVRQHKLNSTGQRAVGAGRKGFLRTDAQRLFFVLFYFKCYPTFDLASIIFDCDRSKACLRQHELSKLLEMTLGIKLSLPKRQMRNMEDFLKAFPEAKDILIDGTERPIQRPKDKVRQKDNYSGKKKRHTVKNIVITDKNKRIGYLSKTVNGKEHDFTILKNLASPNHMPLRVKKHLDLGFQGFANQFPGHNISMPKRSSKLKQLTVFAKEQNKKKSSIRVLVENALAGVKRLKIVTDVYRNKVKSFDDRAMLISCGLWNYHLASK